MFDNIAARTALAYLTAVFIHAGMTTAQAVMVVVCVVVQASSFSAGNAAAKRRFRG